MTEQSTIYDRMVSYLEEHVYTKGRHKGDAPADPDRRSRTHFRVVRYAHGPVAVRFHRTDIVKCSPDTPNTIQLDSGGYAETPTTREAFDILRFTVLRGVPIFVLSTPRVPASMRPSGHRTVLRIANYIGPTLVFTDGGTLTLHRQNGMEWWAPAGFPQLRRYVADRAARRAARQDPNYRALKDTWPLLWAAGCVDLHGTYRHLNDSALRAAIEDPSQWPAVVRNALAHETDAAKAWAWVDDRLFGTLRIEVDA